MDDVARNLILFDRYKKKGLLGSTYNDIKK